MHSALISTCVCPHIMQGPIAIRMAKLAIDNGMQVISIGLLYYLLLLLIIIIVVVIVIVTNIVINIIILV